MTTKIEVKHTPTPWHTEYSGYTGHQAYIYSENGKAIASTIHPDFGLDEQAANGTFIVQAVNSHEELLTLCQSLLADVESAAMQGYGPTTNTEYARKAITKAEAK